MLHAVQTNILSIVITIISSVIVAAILATSEWIRGPRIIYYKTKPSSTIRYRQYFQTQTLFIQNLGYKEAHDVQIFHNWEPTFFDVDASPSVEAAETADGKALFKIGTLRPLDTFRITYMYNTPPPGNDSAVQDVRAHNCTATEIVKPRLGDRQSGWIRWMLIGLTFIGAWYVVAFIVATIWHFAAS